MITYKDIMKAINTKIRTKIIAQFPKIIIESNNIEEGIKRPSFFVQFDNMNAKNFMEIGRDRRMTVYVYYFPENKYKNQMELLSMREELETLWLYDPVININGYFASVSEVDLDVIDNKGQDKVLRCRFDLFFYEEWEKAAKYEKMEDLKYKQEVD